MVDTHGKLKANHLPLALPGAGGAVQLWENLAKEKGFARLPTDMLVPQNLEWESQESPLKTPESHRLNDR